MFTFAKVGLASVVAGAVLAIGGSGATAAPVTAPLAVAAPRSVVPFNPPAPPPYTSSTSGCTVYPATVTAGGYVAFVCKGFSPHTLVVIRGPRIYKIRYTTGRGKIAIALHLKSAGFFTLSATGTSPDSKGKHHHRSVTYTATVTVLPS